MLTEESMVYPLSIGIEIVHDDIGVAGMTGSEDNDLEVFAEVFEDFFGVGADVDASLDDFSGWELDGQFDAVRRIGSVVAVDKRLIEVKNNCLFV